MEEYERLIIEIRLLQAEGRLPTAPTREQRIDWAYGNVRIHNPNVTREMVEKAADDLDREKAQIPIGQVGFTT